PAAICASAPAAGISAAVTACLARIWSSTARISITQFSATAARPTSSARPAWGRAPSPPPPRVRRVPRKGRGEGAGGKSFVTPAEESARETVLQPNELLTEIIIPHSGSKNATYEVRQKEALDWPLAAAAVSLKMKGNSVESARVVLGAVAPTPWPAPAANQA